MSSIIVRCFEITTVTTFNVSFNKLKCIPDTIGLLQKLVTLDLRLGYCTTLSLSPLSFSLSSHVSLSQSFSLCISMICFSLSSSSIVTIFWRIFLPLSPLALNYVRSLYLSTVSQCYLLSFMTAPVLRPY